MTYRTEQAILKQLRQENPSPGIMVIYSIMRSLIFIPQKILCGLALLSTALSLGTSNPKPPHWLKAP